MVDALDAAGDASLAREVAHRFLALAESSGFPENYDALTGEALRDKAYTWTASVYLILSREYA
jgi:glycogen debranching enzyme